MRRSVIAIGILIIISVFMPKAYFDTEKQRECACLGPTYDTDDIGFCYGVVRDCVCLRDGLYRGCQDYSDNFLISNNMFQSYIEGYQDCEHVRITVDGEQIRTPSGCHECVKMPKPYNVPLDGLTGEITVEFDYYIDEDCMKKETLSQRLHI